MYTLGSPLLNVSYSTTRQNELLPLEKVFVIHLYKKNHKNTGGEKSKINRKEFKNQRKTHWKNEWDNGRFDDI